MQLMQNFLLRLNVFPPFNGLMERRLAIYTTRTPVETFTSPCARFNNYKPIWYYCQLYETFTVQIYSLFLDYSIYLI